MPVDAVASPTLRTVLLSGVTGAVGGEVARQLLASGVRLGLPVRRSWQVAKTATALGAPRGQVLIGQVGPTDGEATAGFVKGVEDALGPVDALICCAGGFVYAAIGEDRGGVAAELFEGNVLSSMTLVRAVVPPMKRRRSGVLVFTGARAALTSPPPAGMSLYFAAKTALHGYAAALHQELAADGIRTAVVAPGIIDTEANRTAMPDADRSGWHGVDAVARTLIRAAAGQLAGPILAVTG